MKSLLACVCAVDILMLVLMLTKQLAGVPGVINTLTV